MRREGVPFLTLLSVYSYVTWEPGPQMHIHRGCLELSFCDRGSLVLETAEGRMRILPGMVFAMPCDRPHHYVDTPKGSRIFTALIPMTGRTHRLAGLPRNIGEGLVRMLKALPSVYAVDRQRTCAAFCRLLELLNAPDEDKVIRRLRLGVAGIELLMALTSIRSDRAVGKNVQRIVDKWMRKMSRDPEGRFDTMKMIAGESVNKLTFLRAFRDVSGYTPKAYHTLCRVRRAEELLAAGQSVKATADQLGYCSPQHFATVFRRVTGKSPSDLA